MLNHLTERTEKMTENLDPFGNDKAQLNALMQVINEITQHKVPQYEMHELTSKSALRELQFLIDDCNVLDDGDTVDTLNQVRIEIKYLCSVINDLRERLQHLETENARLERLVANGI